MKTRVILAVVFFLSLSSAVFAEDEASFMRDIRKDLSNVQLRADFADWLEANGQGHRARFMKALIERDEIRGLNPRDVNREDENSKTLYKLMERHQREIAPGLPEHYYAKNWTDSAFDVFTLGGLVIIPSKINHQLIKDLPKLLGKDESPVVGLKLLSSSNPKVKELLKHEELERVVHLEMFSTQFPYTSKFLSCQHLKNLRWLSFKEPAALFQEGDAYRLAMGIAEREVFANLKYLWLPLWTGLENPKSERFETLFQAYLMSPILKNVKASPLIYPASSDLERSRPAQPYIPQKKWAARKGRAEKAETDAETDCPKEVVGAAVETSGAAAAE